MVRGPQEPALPFGRELQRERERRNIPLGWIAEHTKVPQRHLLALEQEEFDVLPGGVFRRGILRSYCRCVGLNEEEWLARLPLPGQLETGQGWTEFATNVQRSRVRTTPQMRMRWWGVLLMMAALGALCWATWRFVVQTQMLHSSSTSIASRPSQV
jgi:cytoskeletal protein RodZ